MTGQPRFLETAQDLIDYWDGKARRLDEEAPDTKNDLRARGLTLTNVTLAPENYPDIRSNLHLALDQPDTLEGLEKELDQALVSLDAARALREEELARGATG